MESINTTYELRMDANSTPLIIRKSGDKEKCFIFNENSSNGVIARISRAIRQDNSFSDTMEFLNRAMKTELADIVFNDSYFKLCMENWVKVHSLIGLLSMIKVLKESDNPNERFLSLFIRNSEMLPTSFKPPILNLDSISHNTPKSSRLGTNNESGDYLDFNVNIYEYGQQSDLIIVHIYRNVNSSINELVYFFIKDDIKGSDNHPELHQYSPSQKGVNSKYLKYKRCLAMGGPDSGVIKVEAPDYNFTQHGNTGNGSLTVLSPDLDVSSFVENRLRNVKILTTPSAHRPIDLGLFPGLISLNGEANLPEIYKRRKYEVYDGEIRTKRILPKRKHPLINIQRSSSLFF